jgi:hypothetical protein
MTCVNEVPRRPWFRFSVRTLFVLVTLVALALGWFAFEQYTYRQQYVEAAGEKVLPKGAGILFDHIVRFNRISGAVITVIRRVEDEASLLDAEETLLTRSIDAARGGSLALRFRISKGRLEVIRTDCERTEVVLDLAPQHSPPASPVYTGASIPMSRIRRNHESEIARLQLWAIVDPSGRRIREIYIVNLRPE